jgi:hypothetical protein
VPFLRLRLLLLLLLLFVRSSSRGVAVSGGRRP